MRSPDKYQILMISLFFVVTAMLGVFVYRELFPEYKIYQNAYAKMEGYRAAYTGEPVPPFQTGVQQIVMPREDLGPEKIDRCTSCHAALKLEHFSRTTIAKDINGQMILDDEGHPVKVSNDNYIWGRLDREITALKDKEVLSQLEAEGKQSDVHKRLKRAKELESWKTTKVGQHHYDLTNQPSYGEQRDDRKSLLFHAHFNSVNHLGPSAGDHAYFVRNPF